MTRACAAAALLLALACSSSKSDRSGKSSEPTGGKKSTAGQASADDAEPTPQLVELPPAPPVPPTPLGIPEARPSEDNPITAQKVALGQLLFFDERLSAKRAAACASCHQPDKGWADGEARSKTVAGKPNLRHTPSLVNVAYADELFWDGRMAPLEQAIDAHWQGQQGADPEQVVALLARMPVYRAHFERTFAGPPSRARIVEALAAFARTIRSGNAPYDRYEVEGAAGKAPAQAIAGAKVFAQKAQCALCHPPPLYTDLSYHGPGSKPSTGAAATAEPVDIGRARVTKKEADVAAFKTPTVRGVMHSAPYFHDGSAVTLEDAVARCLGRGGPADDPAHGSRAPVHLSAGELDQVIAFLQSLTPARDPYPRPALPPAPPPPAP